MKRDYKLLDEIKKIKVKLLQKKKKIVQNQLTN